MNRIKKALFSDNSSKNDSKSISSSSNSSSGKSKKKKRLSLFRQKTETNVQDEGAPPHLPTSFSCTEYPPNSNANIAYNHNRQNQVFGIRSAHSLTSFDGSLLVASSSSSSAAAAAKTSATSATSAAKTSNPLISRSLQSIHSSSTSSSSDRTPSSNSIKRLSQATEDTQDYLQLGMKCHEKGELEKATHYWRLSAEGGSPLGLFFYGIALRHGWGCKRNPTKAVQYLQSAAECAVYDLQTGIAQSASVAKSELVLAIYELGVCFRHGWGVSIF
ncbi:hypothetical protein [Parasitella parasitica]|uniref:Protein DSF2 n=1 Tax=Parasitella parasitica TaxID=35722 RepID=A0A0B7NWZ8_9FUNG|nr:hypothetical protein [Parasitella parasitica]